MVREQAEVRVKVAGASCEMVPIVSAKWER